VESVAQLYWAEMKLLDIWEEDEETYVIFYDPDMTITYFASKSLGGTIEIGKNKSSSDVYINQSKNKLKIVPAPGEDAGISQVILQKV
jgi:hypothetical protein